MVNVSKTPIRTILFMGLVGSGKGTQARMISEKTGYPVFSSGAYYRELAQQDTAVGEHVREVIDKGYLMPEWFHTYVMLDTLLGLDTADGILLEVSRRKKEAIVFHEMMEWLGRPYKVIYLDIPEDVAVERLAERYQREGRKDDHIENIPTRLEEYKTHTIPAVEFFREKGTLLIVNGDQTPEHVHQEVLRVLGA